VEIGKTWRGLSRKACRNSAGTGICTSDMILKPSKSCKNLRNPGRIRSHRHMIRFLMGKDAAERNFGFRAVKVLEGNTGYIEISEINISVGSLPVLFAAMRFVANTRALVIDLRNNGGGGSNVGSVLESFFLRGHTPLLEFRTRNGSMQTEKTVGWLLEPKYEKPLFILVNKGTASAAEAFAYALQKHRRAKVVGQRSAGAAFMNSWYPVNEHLYISISTGAPTWPGTTENWEVTGINPDYIVAEGTELAAVAQLLK
jgi:C-terminal processing protease CtpA/Prc